MRSTVYDLDGWSSVQRGLPSRREDRDLNRYSRRFTIEMKISRLITHLLTCSYNGQRDTLSLATRQKRSGFSVQRLMLPAFDATATNFALAQLPVYFSSLLGLADRLLARGALHRRIAPARSYKPSVSVYMSPAREISVARGP